MFLLTVLTGAAGATAAVAAESELAPEVRAQAEALFSEGQRLFDAEDFAAACPKLESAVELTRGEALGGKLMLGRCYEKLGRSASAWGLYREVAARAEKAGQGERATQAGTLAQDIQPRLHRVRIRVQPAIPPPFSIWLDDRALPEGARESELPADPGPLRIQVRSPGKQPSERVLIVPSQPGVSEVTFHGPLRALPATPRPRPAEVELSFWSPQRVVGLSLGMFGVAGMGAGGVMAGVARARYDEGFVAGDCAGSPPLCEDPAETIAAADMGNVATGVFFAGAGLVALGTVVMLTAPMASANETDMPQVGVRLSPTGPTLWGTF